MIIISEYFVLMNQISSTSSRIPPNRGVQGGRAAAPARQVGSQGNSVGGLQLLPPDSIARIATGPGGMEDTQILPLLAHATRAEASFLVEYLTAGEGEPVCKNRQWHGRQETVSAMGREIEALASKAISTHQATWRFSRASVGKFLSVVVPFQLPSNRTVCLAVALRDQRTGEGATIAAVMQGYGWWLMSTASNREKNRESELFGRVSGFVEMVKSCSAASDVEEASGIMADHLCELLDCQSVSVVGFRRGSYKLLAASGGLEVEQRSEGRASLEACVADAVKRHETFVLAPRDGGLSSDAIGSAAEAARLFHASGWAVIPLFDGEKIAGGWVALWSKEDPAFEDKLRFLKASAPGAAPFLKVVREAKPEGLPALIHRIWNRLKVSQKRLFISLGVVIAGLMALPVKERIPASASLEPMVRRVVAAPFNSTLRETKVEAGDLVAEGDLLAELDGREIRFQLAEAVANRARASKEADRALDAGKIAESQMAKLEALSFEQQQLINEEREKFLEIRSPIGGVVLQGDLERAEGAPLQTGDRLFEIAPIDTMLIEIALPETEIALVREGMPIKVQLEAHPGEVFDAEISRIPPRSELRQNMNVFVCEASLANPEGALRPGMNGEVKILGDRKMLIWTLIRPAVNFCRLKLWL